MIIELFNYDLPDNLIAQKPLDKRDESRLMVLNRNDNSIKHLHFYDIPDFITEDDLLVLNTSKVIPARLLGKKKGYEREVEVLLIRPLEGDVWEALVRPGKKLKPGDSVTISETPYFEVDIVDYGKDGNRIVKLNYEGDFHETLERVGKMPLPPYIERESTEFDKERYQTIYCNQEGSVAAPTAGLHFTEEILKKLSDKGVSKAEVVLHVGIGTFRPVKCENIEDHVMHYEQYEITTENAKTINEALDKGKRIIAVGTTSLRTLEGAAYYDNEKKGYRVKEGSGETDIFIYPGYEFKIVKALVTNFHLPKSTLLMLVSAFYDREEILKAYNTAVSDKYRFFSYGDAMMII